jgi:hypothetical protein
VNVKNSFTSHIDKKIFLTFLFLTTYLYTFSLYENPSFIILPKGQQKTDNTEKPAALGTHEEKQDINTTQHVSNTTIRRQTHKTELRHQSPTNNDRTSETTTDITTRNPKCKDTK